MPQKIDRGFDFSRSVHGDRGEEAIPRQSGIESDRVHDSELQKQNEFLSAERP